MRLRLIALVRTWPEYASISVNGSPPAEFDMGTDVSSDGEASSRGAYEIVDKLARRGIFLNGAVADGFKAGVDALVESGPTEEEVEWARRVLAAVPEERGVFQFEGKMVDAPVLRHAEQILHRSVEARVQGHAPTGGKDARQ